MRIHALQLGNLRTIKKCVCRVCVMHALHALYAFHALAKSVSYGFIEGWKVQVPSPALPFQLVGDVSAHIRSSAPTSCLLLLFCKRSNPIVCCASDNASSRCASMIC
jgi:hypothetical protein